MNTLPLPTDIRLMNALSAAFMLALVIGAVAWGGHAILTHDQFAMKRISIEGDSQHNSALTLRANVVPKLKGNFFTMDLRDTQRAFEQVPWIRSAVVKRDFPNRVRVRLQEHVPAAMFGVDSESRMVNTFGEVFEANAADINTELPRLVGPDTQATQLLRTLRLIEPLFEPLDLVVEQLELSIRGSLRITLDNAATIDVGRADEVELVNLLTRFLAGLTQATSQLDRKVHHLESADLRYPNGFAIKLQGIATQVPAPKTPVKKN